MLIRCPNCDTAYHVGEEQLRESGGQAVCCRCNEVFEAEIYKIPDDTELLSNTLHDAKQDADEWQPDASLFANIDEEENADVEDIDISSLIEESIAQGELPHVSDKLEEVLEDDDFSAEQLAIKKNKQPKEKQKSTKNENDETLYGDTNFVGIPPDSEKKTINQIPKETKVSSNEVDSIFNKLNDSQLQENSLPKAKEDTPINKPEKTDSENNDQTSQKTTIEDNYLVDSLSDKAPKSPKEKMGNQTKQTESSSQLDAINFNDVKAENLNDDSFTNPSTDNLEDLTDEEAGYQLDSFSDEIILKESQNTNDFNFSVNEESEVVKEVPKKQIKQTESTEKNREIDELGELLDTITKEAVQKDTSFQVDEEFSDLLDNMDSQGLLDEDSALTEEKDSDLSYLTENVEDNNDNDSNLNVESIVEPLIGQSDRTIESNSYFAASSEIAIETILPIRRYKRKIWLTRITSFLLILLLIAQVAWFKQKDIVKFPLGHQIFEKSCAFLGCKVPDKVALEKIKIIKKTFKEHAFIPHALELKIIVKNKAKFEQPYPRLEIILLNNHKTKISQRIFNKKEYLHQKTKNLMPVNKAITFSLIIEEKGRRATTFNAKFY